MLMIPWRLLLLLLMAPAGIFAKQFPFDSFVTPKLQDVLMEREKLLNDALSSDDVISVSRRQMEQIPSHLPEFSEPEPTCAELRAVWRHMRRMARHSEITNEIPTFPVTSYPQGFFGYLVDKPRSSIFPKTKPSNRNRSSLRVPVEVYAPEYPKFGKILRGPVDASRMKSSAKTGAKSNRYYNNKYRKTGKNRYDKTRYKSKPVSPNSINSVLSGTFANSPFPEETLGVFGTVVNSPEEKAFLEKQRYLAKSNKFHGVPNRKFSSRKYMKGALAYGSIKEKQKDKYKYGSIVREPPSGGHETGLVLPEEEEKKLNEMGAFGRVVNRAVGFGPDQESCERLEGEPCRQDDDCSCLGNELQCILASCQYGTMSQRNKKTERGRERDLYNG
ncbi:uncharacterized protein LOC106470905 isoform X2 [Limulus polyphemus]|uniref:Uncharacterized protein LOC106470905 isoform X2 n=1 Tax=Limulus polyphemus TaxID=6850 RepID=A0ABM1TH91_LIMPO|nr:uncharacterized protein LOC106470905 isoform X2 [Limulus polyphemus]